ncbi:DUF4389 domain-containing protein [Allokutzneria sp. NRRL B-24872]|uniref:DUF4389 domain-containing protein n=1 Tax=Allokutzneria sp. NRRL B-24872 TaxID=1137961 RepID=UPI000A3CB988|nr:DUF4389 domain-containing protein [Allokutzneria sp. NRRL B-24872]
MRPRTSPVRISGRPDPELSRWLWLVKWLLAIPHLVVLLVLWTAFWLLTVVVFFAVLITGRYPRGIFEFNLGVLRWTWRVAFYAYSALGTDRYPPFTLAEVPDYPATLDVAYPEQLSRGLVLVKWWLLALPHYLVVALFVGGTGASFDGTASIGDTGLITVLVLIGAIALLFTGGFPRGVLDFVLGMDRWVARVFVYSTLMTDRYPPFRLDGGPEDDEPAPSTSDVPASSGSGPRTGAVVVGAVVLLAGLGLAAVGGAALWTEHSQRDASGYLTAPPRHVVSETGELVLGSVEFHGVPGWLLGEVRVRVESPSPVFVGIGPEAEVARYLGQPRQSPAGQGFWSVSTSGQGQRELLWAVQDGRWNLVVLNEDPGRTVDVDLAVAAKVPDLSWIGVGLLGFGFATSLGGSLLLVVGTRKRVDPLSGSVSS